MNWAKKGDTSWFPGTKPAALTVNITILTTLETRTFRVRPENKTIFPLQGDKTRPYTSLKSVECTVKLVWTVVPHLLVLMPSDFSQF